MTIGVYTMSKGYVVANIRVKDQEKFQQFSGMAGPAIKKYGGMVLARGPDCLLYTSPSPRDKRQSRMPSSA